jgi:hypothetical protein
LVTLQLGYIFSKDYIRLVSHVLAEREELGFASNRHGSKQGDTNIFIADWVE